MLVWCWNKDAGDVSFYVLYNKEHTSVCPQAVVVVIIINIIIIKINKNHKLNSSWKYGWLSSMLS